MCCNVCHGRKHCEENTELTDFKKEDTKTSEMEDIDIRWTGFAKKLEKAARRVERKEEETEKEIKDQKLSPENEKKFKEDAKNRIEMGLILQEIGKVNKISVTPEEMNKALFEYASNFKGQEQKVIDYYRSNQEASMQLQAPLYENKIVDFILSKVKLKKKEVDVDSFIKLYNNVNEVAKPATKKKAAKKKTVKKKSK